MSNSFIRNIKLLEKGMESGNPMIIGIAKLTIALFHLGYVVSTDEKTTIKVDRKYKFVRNGFTEFMIIDKEGNHFNVKNSFWYFKWNSIEDWYNVKEDDELNIKYYGIRMPLFGLFPNIYCSKKSENKIDDEPPSDTSGSFVYNVITPLVTL